MVATHPGHRGLSLMEKELFWREEDPDRVDQSNTPSGISQPSFEVISHGTEYMSISRFGLLNSTIEHLSRQSRNPISETISLHFGTAPYVLVQISTT